MANRKTLSMWVKSLQHQLEYAATLAFYSAMRALPLPVASYIAGKTARAIGPRIGRSNLARRQMRIHLPHASDADIEGYIAEMWDNIGRVFAEYSHMHREAMSKRITIEGGETLTQLKAAGKPFLIIAGHIGNWEVLPKAAYMLGCPLHVIYRPPNNPYTHAMIDRIRMRYSLGHYGKGREGAKGVMDAFKKDESVLILIDQKDNQGSMIDFMQAPAMTMTSAAKLALKFDIPVIPCFIKREHGAHFTVTYQPPLTPPPATGDDESRSNAYMQVMNDTLSDWIVKNPGQWFWLHRRWPKEAA